MNVYVTGKYKDNDRINCHDYDKGFSMQLLRWLHQSCGILVFNWNHQLPMHNAYNWLFDVWCTNFNFL